MPLETILEPINGQEAKEILKSMMNQRIDKIPLLKVGNAFKQITLGFDLIFQAFPADCPVPSAEWQILIGLDNGDDPDFSRDIKKIEMLEARREQLVNNLEKIDEFLAKYHPTEELGITESDNGIPDELRMNHNLKLPMLHTSPSGKKTEVLVDSKEIK